MLHDDFTQESVTMFLSTIVLCGSDDGNSELQMTNHIMPVEGMGHSLSDLHPVLCRISKFISIEMDLYLKSKELR